MTTQVKSSDTPTVPACPICSGELAPKFPLDNPFGEKVWLVRCQQCHAEHLEPQPSDALLAEQYKNYFKRRDSRLHLIKEEYFKYLLAKVQLDLAGRKVADVGAGEGYLLSALAQLYPSADLTGVEQGWKDAAPAWLNCKKIGSSIEEWLAVAEEPSYDAIFGCDIIEHVRHPAEVITQISRLKLKPGGWLVITTPNTDSSSAQAMGQMWAQYKLEHITLFGRQSIEKMAERAGLQTQRLEPLAKKLPLGYLMQVSSNFGPQAMQRISRAIAPLVPDLFLKFNLTLMLGEWLWVAQKRV